MFSFITSVGFLRSVSRSIKRQCYQTTARYCTAKQAERSNLKSLERHFERRLRSVHQKFADVPDSTVFHAGHHIYIVEEHGVYRMAHGEGEQDMVQVLSTDWAGDVDAVIQRVRLSPTESMLAATMRNHREEARFMLVRLEPSTVPQGPMITLNNVFSFEWATDDVLFYTTQEGLRCRHVFRLTNAGAHSVLVYEENDPEFFVEVIRTRDQRMLTVNCSSKNSSEVWMIDSKSPFSAPSLVQPRQPGLLYHIEHSDNKLYVLANTSPDHEYQLLRTPLTSPSMQFWEPIFTPEPGEVIKDMEMLEKHCVFTVRGKTGQLQLQTIQLQTPKKVVVHQLPSWACALETNRSETVNRDAFSFILSSPVHPPVHYSLFPSEKQPLSCEDMLQHKSFPECHTTRLQAVSKDGTTVPLTLFHLKALADLSKAPLLVHVYGAYGRDLNMSFSPEKRLLLEDGWVLAYCHVRGGGECGMAWYQAGRLQSKQNGVDDLASCIQTLFQSGVSQPTLTALTACSAGAVLAGALCNQQPHLLKAVLLQAPFLNVLGTMEDLSLPLTVEEIGEWGEPLKYPQHRDYIASYCPCHNITPQLYPSMLITAYSGDMRVPVSGVLKYAEKLKSAIQTHSSLHSKGDQCRKLKSRLAESLRYVPAVRLEIHPGGDHFGPETFDQLLQESARQLAFLYTTLGLDLNGSRQKRRRRNNPSICGRGSRQRQQEHVDNSNIFLTSPGAHTRLVMIPDLHRNVKSKS